MREERLREAIDVLRYGWNLSKPEDLNDAIALAVESLELRIKKTPDVWAQILPVCECARMYRCPNCGEIITRLDRYCQDCGQAIDWSEED